MKINHVFYKTYLINRLQQHITVVREELLAEFTAAGTDTVIWMRRFRMLRQLAAWESQVIEKIYSFDSDSADDYLIDPFVQELITVTSRNA
jgi:hypothetical protein